MRKEKIRGLLRKYEVSPMLYGYRLSTDDEDVVRIVGDGWPHEDEIAMVDSLQRVVLLTDYFPSEGRTIVQLLGRSPGGLVLLARWFSTFRIENGINCWAELFVIFR